MAYVAVDGDGAEYIYIAEPKRSEGFWNCFNSIQLPKGSIKKLIGIELTWEDEPVELAEDTYLTDVEYKKKYGVFKNENMNRIEKETILETIKAELQKEMKSLKESLEKQQKGI